MSDVVLVLNAGSSSLKFAVFETGPAPARVTHGRIEGLGDAARMTVRGRDGETLSDRPLTLAGPEPGVHERALAALLDWLDEHRSMRGLHAVGHRVVHGGARFRAPVRVTAEVLAQLEALCPLAPLHQPHNLQAVRAMSRLQPGIPQIACFDTAFHATQPWVAQAFALPRALSDDGIRRYGFHGLSYEYIAQVLPDHLGPLADGRVVVAHLGNGASLCALRARRSIATTMGFTATDGLMMGTRCGSLDPGVVLHLITQLHMSPAEVRTLLNERSGLLGVSGLSADMRVLEASGAPQADAAIELFAYRIVRELGSLAAALGGLDALVFTAGIGEHSARVREQVCRGAAWLGLQIDPAANAAHAARISTDGSRVAVCVIPTDEELAIVRQVQAMESRDAPSP